MGRTSTTMIKVEIIMGTLCIQTHLLSFHPLGQQFIIMILIVHGVQPPHLLIIIMEILYTQTHHLLCRQLVQPFITMTPIVLGVLNPQPIQPQ